MGRTILSSIWEQAAWPSFLTCVFPWMILLPAGVIVSGKLLHQRWKVDGWGSQFLRIPSRGVMRIEATGGEVILGFAAYMVVLLFIGATAGGHLAFWVRAKFGIDPGQFNALRFVSSLATVAASSVLYNTNKSSAPNVTTPCPIKAPQNRKKPAPHLAKCTRRSKHSRSGATMAEERIYPP